MVWWSDRFKDPGDMPPELANKKPEEIVADLKKARDLEAALAAEQESRKKLEEKLQTQTTEFDGIKTKLAQIESQTLPPPVVPDPEEPPSPWINPEKFVQDQTKSTTGIALTAGIMAAKMYFTQSLTGRDAKIFKKFEKEVDQTVGTFDVTQRVMPQSWFNAFMYIKGLHEQDINKAESAKTDFFSESATMGGPPEPEKEEVLTPDEEEACRKFHWDPKAYLERKKKGQAFESGKGSYAKFTI